MKITTAAVLIELLFCATISFGVYVTECGWWLLLLCFIKVNISNKDDEEETK